MCELKGKGDSSPLSFSYMAVVGFPEVLAKGLAVFSYASNRRILRRQNILQAPLGIQKSTR